MLFTKNAEAVKLSASEKHHIGTLSPQIFGIVDTYHRSFFTRFIFTSNLVASGQVAWLLVVI